MHRPSVGTALAVVAATLFALALGGLLFAASGLYNVAASKPHFALTYQFLQFALERSVSTHSWFAPDAPELDDPDLVGLGAGHFLRGCAFCHGAPGERRNLAAEHMQPQPPDLSLTAGSWSDRELFWIVKNGFKFTGMPAWPAQTRDDEVWAVVAFLRKLPDMQPETYRKLVGRASGAEFSIGIDPGDATAAGELPIVECTRCHGDADTPPVSRLVPKLAGQTHAYLRQALEDYAEHRRASGVMELLASPLEPQLRQQLASYFAGLDSKPQTTAPASNAQIERGLRIARDGLPNERIPPCLACHSGRAAASFPLLSGQPAPYLVRQLRLFREGLRAGTAQAAIMTAVAERLSEEQIADVAAYFESRVPAEDTRPDATPVEGAGQ